MKDYIPEKMISQSRFRDLYGKMSADEQDRIKRKMESLLVENQEYADSKNYGHLCNLITSLALVFVYEENGESVEEAIKTVADAMYEFIRPQIRSMEKLASHGWFVRLLKIAMPLKFKATLGYGWNVEFPECPKDTFAMTTHDCIYKQIFTKYDLPQMTAVFCNVDDILYSNLPRTEFIYTEQIGRGGAVCDYSFKER